LICFAAKRLALYLRYWSATPSQIGRTPVLPTSMCTLKGKLTAKLLGSASWSNSYSMTLNRHLLVDDLTYLKLAVLDTADLAIAHNSDALLILRFPATEMERFRLGILAFQTERTERLWLCH
jgi:hypothetical protein